MLFERLFWSAYMARHLLGQSTYPFRSLESIERDRDRRVRAMVRYAYATVPYYRRVMDERGLRAADIRTADDLANLPIVDRRDLQREPDSFLSTRVSPEQRLGVRSGGSSGMPITVFHDTAALFQNAAHGERERSIYARLVGKTVGYREAVIASPMSTAREVHRFSHSRVLSPNRVRIERQYLSLLDPVESNVELLNAFEPDVIHSYGSYLGVLFSFVLANQIPFHQPKVITFSSDGISESVRRLIQDQLGIPVLGTYQAVEAFKIGFECLEHRGYHVNVDLYPLRVADRDQVMAAGGTGELVVSNLVNRATVLLNYRLEDIAALVEEPCPCGRSLPLLSPIQGRADDWIALPSGRVVHPQLARSILSGTPHVWQYQILQLTATRLQVTVVADSHCDQVQTRGLISARFAEALGSEVQVEVMFVSSIPRTAGGKHRIVRRLESENGQ